MHIKHQGLIQAGPCPLKVIVALPKVLRWGLKWSGWNGASLQAWEKPLEADLRGWKMTYDPWKTTTLEQNSGLLKGRYFLII